MKKVRDSKLYLYLIIGVLGIGIIASDIALMSFILKNKTLQSSVSVASKLEEQNKILTERVAWLKEKNTQLKSEIDDLMALQILETDSEKQTAQFKEMLNQKAKEYAVLKEEYDSLNQAYNELLKEGLSDSQKQQAEQAMEEGQRHTRQQMEEMRTTIRERTYETLDNRINQAKTDYELGIFTEMKQRYNNIFELSDKFRTAEGEERAEIRNAIAEEWVTLGQLYHEYNDYQWKTLAEEYGIENTEEFVKRVGEIQGGFGERASRSGMGGRGPGSGIQPPQ